MVGFLTGLRGCLRDGGFRLMACRLQGLQVGKLLDLSLKVGLEHWAAALPCQYGKHPYTTPEACEIRMRRNSAQSILR